MTLARRIRRLFLPSATLGQYLARVYLMRFLLLLIGLTSVLQLLDLMATYDELMQASGATPFGQMGTYLVLRIPQLASQFVPFTALLGTLLALALFSQHSEIIVMKASGLSAYRILFPLMLASGVIALAHFIFNETIVIDANEKLRLWEESGYAVDFQPVQAEIRNARLVEGNTVIIVATVSHTPRLVYLDNVSISERDDEGIIITQTRADFATHTEDGWQLHGVRRFNTITLETEFEDIRDWDVDIDPDRFLISSVQADFLTFSALYSAIRQLSEEGRATSSLLASLLHKIIGPLASLLMPILGAVAGFGVHRGGTLLVRLVTGMALGFTFFIADNFMLAMGEFGVAPPFLAAGAPFLLFLSVGFAVLFFTEE